MRAEPNTNAPMITLIPFDAQVISTEQRNQEETISGKTAKWHQVSYKDESKKEYVGWVFGEEGKDIQLILWVFLFEKISLYKLPNTLSSIIGECQENSMLKIIRTGQAYFINTFS